MEDLLQVGVVTTTHGVHGEVKVFPTTDDVNRFLELKEVLLDTGKEMRPLEVAGVKFFKQMVILKFSGLDQMEDVEKFRQKGLYVKRENAVKLKKNEYFIADLIGITVYDEEGNEIGKLKDVLTTGANDVYVVESSLTKSGELLIPAIRSCILDVNMDEEKMTVHLMEGLLDL